MGKKNKPSNNLGRALIKNRFSSTRNSKRSKDPALLHSADVDDGYDWGRLNLQSVTEESSFQEFLSTAQLAGTEFEAEKLNIKFVNPNVIVGLLSDKDKEKVKNTQDRKKQLLGIPRRPKWDANTTPEQLQQSESEAFLDWRRRLANLQEEEGLILTPYEKNLEFWKQLWRVVEKSDVVVQIVDARNPLLFRCEDLETYVKEVSPNKQNLILMNKADFLTQSQREAWAKYFSSINVEVAFFSALKAAECEGKDASDSDDENNAELSDDDDDDNDDEKDNDQDSDERDSNVQDGDENDSNVQDFDENDSDYQDIDENDSDYQDVDENESDYQDDDEKSCSDTKNKSLVKQNDVTDKSRHETGEHKNSSKLLSREELVTFFKNIHVGPKVTTGLTTIGLVGYPNVGKSSTINTLLTYKKVSVSATPGKTKHFQTLFLEKDLMLCDCPGLVTPSFMFTKAEMITNGILPIDQMRDHFPPVTIVASLIPRSVLESTYGLMLPQPTEGEDPNRHPTAEEVLNAYGYNRGFMTQNGQPDNPRSARYILKDFVNGKLLHCYAPPGYDQAEYHIFPETENEVKVNTTLPPLGVRLLKANRTTVDDLDRQFFQKASVGLHAKGYAGRSNTNVDPTVAKPWKDHRNKRNRRVKLRRVYAYLDH